MPPSLTLFSEENNLRIMHNVINQLEKISKDDDIIKTRCSHIDSMLKHITSNGNLWDNNCQFNISHIGPKFINTLVSLSGDIGRDILDDIYVMLLRFITEFYLMQGELSLDLVSDMHYGYENQDTFSKSSRMQIDFAMHGMPISILANLANNENIKGINRYYETLQDAEKKREAWDKELETKVKQVEILKTNLETYKAGFNFIGLHQGFDDMSALKVEERNRLSDYMMALSLIIILPLAIEIIFILDHSNNIVEIQDTLLIMTIPTISLVGILLYFFRVMLFNYKSVKSQLLQIELRKTLCRFIQHYADYSQSVKEKDKESLSKFENIVFAGIVSDDDKLPSTFDGIEQITNILKSIKQ